MRKGKKEIGIWKCEYEYEWVFIIYVMLYYVLGEGKLNFILFRIIYLLNKLSIIYLVNYMSCRFL